MAIPLTSEPLFVEAFEDEKIAPDDPFPPKEKRKIKVSPVFLREPMSLIFPRFVSYDIRPALRLLRKDLPFEEPTQVVWEKWENCLYLFATEEETAAVREVIELEKHPSRGMRRRLTTTLPDRRLSTVCQEKPGATLKFEFTKRERISRKEFEEEDEDREEPKTEEVRWALWGEKGVESIELFVDCRGFRSKLDTIIIPYEKGKTRYVFPLETGDEALVEYSESPGQQRDMWYLKPNAETLRKWREYFSNDVKVGEG